MWLLQGPFDGDGEVNFSKTKCLRTNATYPLGRKDRALVVVSKKVSQEHCDFVVGNYTIEDVGNPAARPALQVVNKRTKAMMVLRGSDQITMNPAATYDLLDGDTVAIVGGVYIKVEWMPVCCFVSQARGKSAISLDACASLGVNVIYKTSAQTTHHLTSTYAASPAAAASLISACHFVKPEWLLEVIRLGDLPPNDVKSLQHTFNLPGTSKFRPTFSPSLLPPQKVFSVWEPNEERISLFKDCRFVCIGEPGRELDSDLREAIMRGAGAIETFDVHGGRIKLHKTLTRGRAKEGTKLIVICDSKSMEASVGGIQWLELATEIASFGLGATPPANIITAVLTIDVHALDSSSTDVEMPIASESSSLPDFVPNTLSQEPSIPPIKQPPPEEEPRPVKKLTRRATSRQPSIEPLAVVADELPQTEPSRPRQALTRRVNAGGPIVTGLDDPSVILTMPPNLDEPAEPPPVIDLTAPTPGRPSRLKRRVVGGVPPESQNGLGLEVLSLGGASATEEPPLKKFKALFDASHPDNTGTSSVETFSDFKSATISDSQTQSQTQMRSVHPQRATQGGLDRVEEEEEETQSGLAIEHRPKRKFAFDDDVMEEDQPEAGSSTAFKKRAIENVNSVETANAPPNPRASRPPDSNKAPKPTKSGAPPGNPDKDPAFLKALASTKRGKKAESEFDREFNNLKISKPDLGRDIQENEWAVLDDFSRETNIRGNFMVVVELDVFKTTHVLPGSKPSNINWAGKPDFKKFKKKNDRSSKPNQVQVFSNQEMGNGIGSAYWKGKGKQDLATFAETQPIPEAGNDLSQPLRKPKTQPLVDDSDEENVMIPYGKSKKTTSRAGSAVPAKRAATRTKKAQAKANPLFIDSEDETQAEADAPMQEDEKDVGLSRTTRSRPPSVRQTTTRGRGKKTQAALKPIVDDDSDDGVAFKGF